MKTLKLALAGTALVGALTTAMANTCSFSGFYAGAQVGMGTMNTRVNTTYESTVAINEKFAATGMVGGLHVGYGKHFPNRFYLGMEGWGSLSNNKENHILTDTNVFDDPEGPITIVQKYQLRAERKNALALALRPGMVFGNTLVNAILGIESAKFKYLTNIDDSDPVIYSSSKRRYGFVPGLEVSFHANDHVVLGLRATHTMYRKKDNFRTQATDVVARASYKW